MTNERVASPSGIPTTGATFGEARRRLRAMYAALDAARDQAVRDQAVRRYTEAAPTAAQDAAAPTAWPVALVPAHRARVRRVAARRHAALVQRLRDLIAFVRTHDARDDERTLEQPAPLSPTAVQVVVATCTACRGACCGNGGDHAFLRSSTLRAFMAAHPELDDEGVVAAYTAHLPTHAMHPGCVYQGRAGCTLPRDMRSAICNAYLCTGLQRALDGALDGATRGVYVAHRSGDTVRGGRLRALPVLDG